MKNYYPSILLPAGLTGLKGLPEDESILSLLSDAVDDRDKFRLYWVHSRIIFTAFRFLWT